MQSLKQTLIAQVIRAEGGYSNDPSDRGGETMYGITKAVARENGYTGPMADLSFNVAFALYEKRYWQPLKLDHIASYHDDLAVQLFDFGVHSGITKAGKTLQQVLNVLNQQQTLYSDLTADGIVGSKTLEALKLFYQHRQKQGLVVLFQAIKSKRMSFCIDIALSDQTQERYQYGWLKRIVNL